MLIKSYLSYVKKNTKLTIGIFLAIVLLMNTILVLANDTNFSNHYPTKNSTITISNPKISVYVKSTSNLYSQSVNMKINDIPVSATFQYKGKWVEDYYVGRVWVITDRKEGTISFDASKLIDGINNVVVSISNQEGIVLSDTWSFNVKAPPKIENIYPAQQSSLGSVTKIAATLSDNNGVDWTSPRVKINTNDWIYADSLDINQETGIVTYYEQFPTGSYNVTFEVTDISGNVATRSWEFLSDSSPPDISYLYDFYDGMNITDGNLKIRVGLKDLNDLKDNVTLSLNGSPLNINLKYKGYTDYYGGYVVTSKKEAYISYEGIVPNGNHTLSLYSEDILGNQVTRYWTFKMAADATILNETPKKYGVNQYPTISADIALPNGTVSSEQITLKVDGVIVNHSYDGSTGKVSYTPVEPLTNESYHTVSLTVLNESGTSTNKQWKFYTNTYPDMYDANISYCLTCHEANSTEGSIAFEDVHQKKLRFDGTHIQNNCENCHNFITYTAGCSQCHEGDDFDYAPHGSTPTVDYQPKNFDINSPLRVQDNREMWDCIVCHQPGSGVKGYDGPYSTTPTRLLNNHDIPELHKTTDETCTACHAKSLTREHAREGRTDTNNNPITCNTCHQSAVTKVINAINTKDKSCSACHETVHEAVHATCSDCHKD